MVIKQKRNVKRRGVIRKPQSNWLGGSLSLNHAHRTLVKRHDVFKTNPKYVMSAMFKDSDRDGVANAFDCKPGNKNQQGLIDNMIKIFKKKKKDSTITSEKSLSGYKAEMKRQGRERKILAKAKAGMKQPLRKRILDKVGPTALILAITRANPKYDMEMEQRIVGMKPMSKAARKKLNLDYELMRRARVARRQLLGGGASTRANTLTRTITGIFPQVQARTASGGAVGVPGQRGRPRGSFEGKYASYGGVFGYRKAVALRKKAAKFSQQQAELQAKLSGQPQYETQQYQQQPQQQQVQQVPQETPGAVPDYSQFQALQDQAQQGQEVIYEQAPQAQSQPQYQQPQYQQPPQQYAPEPYKRPIATVFKSSGGSPYGTKAPIVQGSLAPSNAYGDYIEYADAFTGERKWKKKIQPEGWSKPKDQNQAPIVDERIIGRAQ